MVISMFGITHVGSVRDENEDAVDWWIDPSYQVSFAVLADGMGGHAGGALASRLAIETIRGHVQQAIGELGEKGEKAVKSIRDLKPVMIEAVDQANAAIRQAREEQTQFEKMGTTVVFVAVMGSEMLVLHAGDSRCYLHTGAKPLALLTRDDSVVQAMLDEGAITAEEVPNIPYRNTLTNALGIQASLSYTLKILKLKSNDQVLLCSDGLYNAITTIEMSGLLKAPTSVEEKARKLVQASLEKQTDDNTSVIVIRVASKAASKKVATKKSTSKKKNPKKTSKKTSKKS